MSEDASTGTPPQGQDPGTPQQAGGHDEQPKTDGFHQDSFDKGFGKAADKFRSDVEASNKRIDELTKELKAQKRAAVRSADAEKTAEELSAEVEKLRAELDEAGQRDESNKELFTGLIKDRFDALPDEIKALAPEGASPAGVLEWLRKAEKAAPQQKPAAQGGSLPDSTGLKLDPTIYDPGRGGSVTKYRQAVKEYGQEAVDRALAH